MDQGTLRATDPSPATSRVDRRRRVRQRLHSPVYASFKSAQAGMVVDLSELLDLNEDGFAVHTPEPLETDRALALTLDLPETRAYIHGHGVAIWSDASGRGGVRFSDLSDPSRRLLKEWLFANLLVACANHAARTEQRSRQEESAPPEPEAPAATAEPASAVNAALSPMEAVREQVRAGAHDPTTALNLIVGCAREWTGASGAALALLTAEQMICRARSGEVAPPLEARVDMNHGLSGECVRRAQMVSAEDTENDTRVDREACRALGIGSILAVPIIRNARVVGLLEVFSPRSRAFAKEHATVLDQLAEAVPSPVLAQRAAAAGEVLPATAEPASLTDSSVAHAVGEPESPLKEHRARSLSRNLYLVLMALVAVAATTAGYLLAPTIQSHWFSAPEQTAAAAAPQASSTRSTVATSPAELRRLADSGDAESQYWIGIRYSTGANVAQNDAEAAKWFERAAEQGHVQAQARLASWYWSGRGVPRDLSKAYVWARLAWAQGDENSKMLAEGLASQMTASQVAAARQQADNWLRQHNQQGLSH